jgi:asparagine synthase (glutamine-hydrolysing)
MCGILFTNCREISNQQFEKSLGLLSNRGPDHTKYVKIGNNLIGHTRLSIQDLNPRSNQPFYNKKGNLILTYNGELYNSSSLAKKHNLELQTTSDTEVIIELYEKLGPDFVKELDGMFAIIIYDILTKKIFYSRDRLGIKPLYIYKNKTGIILSSEISPILDLTNDREIDQIGLRQYKFLRTYFRNHTLYRNIHSVEPGTYTIDGKTQKYWELKLGDNSNFHQDELYFLLQEIIKKHLISDVPIGSLLSGGIDSAVILAISGAHNSWCIGSELENEFKEAQDIAKSMNSNHTNIEVSSNEFIEVSRELIQKRQEPVTVPNEVYVSYACKQISQVNKVILSGEGADELFAGYSRLYDWSTSGKGFNIIEFSKLYSYGINQDLEILEYVLEPHMKWSNPYLIVSSFMQVAHLHGLLKRLDSATMMRGVEARVPYVDHILVEKLFGVDYIHKKMSGQSKGLLRSIASKLFSKEIANREKLGFPVNVNKIFNEVGLPTYKSNYETWTNFNLNALGLD